MAGVLVFRRVDAGGDVACEAGGGEGVREVRAAEAGRDGIEHDGAQGAHGGERGGGEGDVVEGGAVRGGEGVEGLAALDEIAVDEVLAAGVVEVHGSRSASMRRATGGASV